MGIPDPDSSDLKTKIASLEAELKTVKKQMKGYAGQIGVLKRQKSTSEPPQAPDKPESSETKPPEAPQTHFVHSYEKFCPDCGGPNPRFKDETECKNCHQHLGSKEEVAKLAACPFCGSNKGAKGL